jgi:hypothetical protein
MGHDQLCAPVSTRDAKYRRWRFPYLLWIQLLYKAKGGRQKDEADFANLPR